MNQSKLIKLAIYCMAALMLTGCVLEGYGGDRGENRHDRDRGDQHYDDHHSHDEHDDNR
jgi:hypothetical protein